GRGRKTPLWMSSSSSRTFPSGVIDFPFYGWALFSSNISPEMFEALVAAEQRAEDGGVRQQYIACTIAIRRHPEKHVEFAVARFDKRMRPRHVDRLFGQHVNRFCVLRGQRVMRE